MQISEQLELSDRLIPWSAQGMFKRWLMVVFEYAIHDFFLWFSFLLYFLLSLPFSPPFYFVEHSMARRTPTTIMYSRKYCINSWSSCGLSLQGTHR